MHNEQITLLFRQLAEADDILRQSRIFEVEPNRVPLPLITVDLYGTDDSLQQVYSKRVSFMPVRMERVELDITPEAVAQLSERPDLKAEIVHALAQRIGAEMDLALLYGIVCYTGIPHARQIRQGVESSLPDNG